ncbi:MAG: hypothetical protein ACYC3I_02670 [Gemmataceae bacterium]
MQAAFATATSFCYVVEENPYREDAAVNSILDSVLWPRVRRLGIGLLLLALPACGISVYEERMRESEEREDLFRVEQQYLDEPVFMPMRKVQGPKETKPHDEPVATVFFRPPKGIKAQPQAVNNFLWRYPNLMNPVFARVEMAFAKDDKNFAQKVLSFYPGKQQEKRHPSLPFNTYELSDSQNGYSINILNSATAKTQVAIIYVFTKEWRDNVRMPIDVSLRSLAVDQDVAAVRQRYSKRSPWRLTGPLSP